VIGEIYRKFIAYGGLLFLGIVTASIRYISFGRAINVNRTIVAPMITKTMLWMINVKIHNKIDQNLNRSNVCYFFNHNSFLDVFIIPTLGLKDTRFIISEAVKKIIPLHLCNLGVDVLYIPDSHKTAERIEFFKSVSKDLSEGKYSVICAPEGRHTFLSGIAPFNNGVFHMAHAAGVPIHTLFFSVPGGSSSEDKNNIRPCDVHITSQEIIEPKNWDLEDIEKLKSNTREGFLKYYYQENGDYGESTL
jgi:1-acyl-sn-glycerol-3-phosphate acyltransferase